MRTESARTCTRAHEHTSTRPISRVPHLLRIMPAKRKQQQEEADALKQERLAAEAEARRVAEQEAAEQVARLARAAAAQGYDVTR